MALKTEIRPEVLEFCRDRAVVLSTDHDKARPEIYSPAPGIIECEIYLGGVLVESFDPELYI